MNSPKFGYPIKKLGGIAMKRRKRKSFEELVQENRILIEKDQSAMEKIEERVFERLNALKARS